MNERNAEHHQLTTQSARFSLFMLVVCVCLVTPSIFALSFLFLESTSIDTHNTTQTQNRFHVCFPIFPSLVRLKMRALSSF